MSCLIKYVENLINIYTFIFISNPYQCIFLIHRAWLKTGGIFFVECSLEEINIYLQFILVMHMAVVGLLLWVD